MTTFLFNWCLLLHKNATGPFKTLKKSPPSHKNVKNHAYRLGSTPAGKLSAGAKYRQTAGDNEVAMRADFRGRLKGNLNFPTQHVLGS